MLSDYDGQTSHATIVMNSGVNSKRIAATPGFDLVLGSSTKVFHRHCPGLADAPRFTQKVEDQAEGVKHRRSFALAKAGQLASAWRVKHGGLGHHCAGKRELNFVCALALASVGAKCTDV
jgi:hypothetical protein